MRYLVGYVADGTGRSALALAGVLADVDERVEIVLCHVLPETSDLPSARGAPATGYDQILHQQAGQWLAHAREQLPGTEVRTLVRTGPSPAAGLAATAEEVGAGMLVVGSARHGVLRRLATGSVAEPLLRSSPVPVAVAPLGFAPPGGTRLRRVSCGFLDRPGDTATVLAARQLAQRNELPLRLVTVVVAESHGFSSLGRGDEAQEQHRAQTIWAADRAAGGLPEDVSLEQVVASGDDLESALAGIDWLDGEVLFLGSSRLGEPARVFLGPTATAILRSSPVPVVALPRGADVSLETTTDMPVLAGGEHDRPGPGRPTGEP